GARRAAAAGGGTVRAALQPLYLVGLALDLVAWLLSLLALRRLPLFAVQAILAGSLAVTVVLARVVFHTVTRRADDLAIGATIAALVVIGASAGAEGAARASHAFVVAALVASVVLAGAATLAAWRASPVVTGALAGLAFGGTALSARAIDTSGSLVHVATRPLALALVVFGATGLLAYATALEHGAVAPVTAALWVTEVVVPAVVGAVALGDRVRAGWTVPAALAVVVALAATVVLAASPAQVAVAGDHAAHPHV
ncbi:MAG TPA: hypothetical protein VHN98_05635, partial [Acidimicrobiales bacterium]|nr:hypothetical protein [Acidimicrobiales bacterium]